MEAIKITADQCQANESYVAIKGVRLHIADLRPKSGYWSEHTFWSAGISPEGIPARQVYGGPLVTERFGWLNADAVVIAAHQLAEVPTIEVNMGDVIEVESYGSWQVAMTSGWDSHPTIVPID